MQVLQPLNYELAYRGSLPETTLAPTFPPGTCSVGTDFGLSFKPLGQRTHTSRAVLLFSDRTGAGSVAAE